MAIGSSPSERAGFSVVSRLLSCFVTESLLRALYIPIQSTQASGVLVILSTRVALGRPWVFKVLYPGDVFAIVPLRQVPVLLHSVPLVHKQGFPVGLVDPLDMIPSIVYELADSQARPITSTAMQEAILAKLKPPPWELGQYTPRASPLDAVYWWNKFTQTIVIPESLQNTIAQELASSCEWQALSYRFPSRCPSLKSTSIEWEQSLVAGHPTHPMHRARSIVSVDKSLNAMSYDWYHPRIRFVSVPRTSINILGEFNNHITALAAIVASKTGIPVPELDDQTVLMPVHELQVANISSRFPDVKILDPEFSIVAEAQASIRTVIIPEFPKLALKMAVGVKISSALRTISHFTTNFGPRFSEIVSKLAIDRTILMIEKEPASANYRTEDPDAAKHLSAILREQYHPPPGESAVVCAALVEMDHSNLPSGIATVQHVFGLDTAQKRFAWLDRYIELIVRAFIPPMIHNGLAFEAHPQNVIARFNSTTGELLGFIVRDLGGLRIHPSTLRSSIGDNFEFLPQHCIITDTIEEAYKKLYHTLVFNHLQRLIRVLDLHYDGRGWGLLRKHLRNSIPKEHTLWREWLSSNRELVSGKCLMRMKIEGVYRDSVYEPVPNLIQYTGVSNAIS